MPGLAVLANSRPVDDVMRLFHCAPFVSSLHDLDHKKHRSIDWEVCACLHECRDRTNLAWHLQGMPDLSVLSSRLLAMTQLVV